MYIAGAFCLQASMQNPQEFTESLSQGVQSLMGHVVGGSFGSAALITGSLGNTIAMLSMDEDYKKVSFVLKWN